MMYEKNNQLQKSLNQFNFLLKIDNNNAFNYNARGKL